MRIRYKFNLLFCCLFPFSLNAQVSNDICADAISVSVGTTCVSGTNDNAETDNAASCVDESVKDIWYKYTAAASGIVSFATNVGAEDSLFNDILSIYTGSCNALTEVKCDNYDEYGFQGEKALVTVTAGQQYYISISGQTKKIGRNTGSFCLLLSTETVFPISPYSEICDNAEFLPLNTDWITGNNENAGTEGIFPDELQRSRADMWYEIVPEYGTNVEIEIAAGFSHVLALYSGTCNDLTLVKRNMQGFDLDVQDLTPETSYFIQVSGRFATLEGDFQIKVTDNSSPAVPTNDGCTTAIPIEPDGECIAFDNTFSTLSGIQPSCVFFPGGDVWFSYTAPNQNAGGLKINSAADFIHSIAVYEGTCADSTEVFCSIAPEPCAGYVEISNLVPGQTYYIQIVSNNVYFAGTGSGCLEIIRSEQSDNFLPLSLDVTPYCQSNELAELIVEISGGQGDYTLTGYTEGEILMVGDTYFVQVEDAAGCTQIASGTVNCTSDNDCELFYYIETQNVSCTGADDGSATVSYSSGTDDVFTLQWSNGSFSNTITDLESGRYTVTIIGASGCDPVVATIDITEPNPLNANFLITPSTAETVANGSVTTLPTGGTPPYNYAWSTGQTSQTINDVIASDYMVTLTDINDCQVVATVSVGIDSSCVESYNLNEIVAPGTVKTYSAYNIILSSSTISQYSTVKYRAGNIIHLKPGFRAQHESDFHAYIEDCTLETTVAVNVTAMLGGVYDAEMGMMRDSLRSKNILPTTEPYSNLGFEMTGGGGETIAADVLSITGNNAIVDWVFLELRDRLDPTIVLASRAALLCRNGNVVETDGVSTVTFANTEAGDYYVTIKHRNHLPIMTATTLTLSSEPTNIDFSSPSTATWGTNACNIQGDMAMMWSGDTDNDGQIIYQGANSDLLPITVSVYTNPDNTNFQASQPISGYLSSDTNLDGITIYQGANSDLLPITISVYSNPENTEFQASFPVFQQCPE